jgi:epoxyqueuosine reductase
MDGEVEKVLFQLEDKGHKGRIVSTRRLTELQEGIEGHHRQGLLDEEFYGAYLAGLKFNPPESLPEARSLIVVAVPDPPTRITFTREGERLPLLVPPTYLHYREIDKRVDDLLAEALAPAGYRVAQARLPKKLLAVRSGLAQYGRNNISYIPGMGSYYRLVAFYSDLPCPEDNWQEPQLLERCQKCRACLRACPTAAISSERFLLRAERCMTFLNEKPTDVPFPSWIDPAWHNCLVGCLHCQRVCPENKEVLPWVEEGEEFSEEETAQLAEGVALDRLSAATAERLERLDLVELLDVLPRNLSVLLSRTKED